MTDCGLPVMTLFFMMPDIRQESLQAHALAHTSDKDWMYLLIGWAEIMRFYVCNNRSWN